MRPAPTAGGKWGRTPFVSGTTPRSLSGSLAWKWGRTPFVSTRALPSKWGRTPFVSRTTPRSLCGSLAGHLEGDRCRQRRRQVGIVDLGDAVVFAVGRRRARLAGERLL